MSKTVLAGIFGGLTLATGFLCYSIYQRDKDEDDSSETLMPASDVKHVEETKIVDEPILKKKRSSTSRNIQRPKANTKRNR